MATFHPAYILRRMGKDREQLMAAYRVDFAEVAKALRELGREDPVHAEAQRSSGEE
jgi:hypothetical protein